MNHTNKSVQTSLTKYFTGTGVQFMCPMHVSCCQKQQKHGIVMRHGTFNASDSSCTTMNTSKENQWKAVTPLDSLSDFLK